MQPVVGRHENGRAQQKKFMQVRRDAKTRWRLWRPRPRDAAAPRRAALLDLVPGTVKMSDDADQTLMTVVNSLGLVIFAAIVVYHFVTSSEKDAE